MGNNIDSRKSKIFENFELQHYELKTITESSKDDLGNRTDVVLAVVEGASFFPDGYSRNGRFYPAELWENALNDLELQEKLKRKLVFGCIGHPIGDYSLDTLLESGRVSHIVTDIRLEKQNGKNVGIARYEILDTPSGRILNTILKAGSKPYVSTRAFGSFTNETIEKGGKYYKVLNPKDFQIESIDFVIEPGFLEASPDNITIRENLKQLNELEKIVEEKTHKKLVCIDGVCELKETLKEVKENKDIEGLEKQYIADDKNIQTFQNSDDVKSKAIESLKKEIETLYKKLEEKNTNEDLEKIEFKSTENLENKVTILLSYLEILLRLIKFDETYNKSYLALSEFLDDKKEITQSDLTFITKVLNDILSNATNSEFVLRILERINDLFKDKSDDDTDDKEDEVKAISNDIKNEIYKTYIDNLSTEMEYKSVVEEYETQLKKQEKKEKILLSTIDNLTEELEKSLNETLKTSLNDNEIVKTLKEDLSNSLKLQEAMTKELQSKNKQIDEMRKIIEELKSELRSKTNESNPNLTDEDIKIIREIESLKAKNEIFTESLKSKDDTIENLNEELKEKANIITELKNENKELKEKFSNCEKSLKEKNEKLVKVSNGDVIELEKIINNLKKDKENLEKELKSQIQDLKIDLNKTLDSYEALKDELKEKERELNEVKSKLDENKKTNESKNLSDNKLDEEIISLKKEKYSLMFPNLDEQIIENAINLSLSDKETINFLEKKLYTMKTTKSLKVDEKINSTDIKIVEVKKDNKKIKKLESLTNL